MAEATSSGLDESLVRFAERVVRDADILCEDTASRLLHAMARVDRLKFVERSSREEALTDAAVSVGSGRMLMKPSIFALMVSLIGLRRGMRILEVGAGTGYGGAVLSVAGAHVFALEQDGLLAQRARRLLDDQHYHGVLVNRGEYAKGWKEHAPFDAVIYSQVVDRIDEQLLSQLEPNGGRLVAPVRGTGVCLWECRESGIVSYPLEVGSDLDA